MAWYWKLGIQPVLAQIALDDILGLPAYRGETAFKVWEWPGA